MPSFRARPAWCAPCPRRIADFRVLGNPLQIDGKRLEQVAAPALGADNDALLPQRSARARMKLGGLKVIDLSWFLPGPFLTMALADHGAEVIKIEPPAKAIPDARSPADGRADQCVLPQPEPRQEERGARPEGCRRSRCAVAAVR